MALTPEKLRKILEAHCKRKVQGMDINELRSYALNGLKESFDKNPGVGDTDEFLLMEDIIEHDHLYGDDIIHSRKFLMSCGIDKNEAKELIKEQVSNEEQTDNKDVVNAQLIGLHQILNL
jgi:hypothetical protein